MSFDFYPFIRPLLFTIDAEDAHGLALKAMKYGLTPREAPRADPILASTHWGLKFPSPVGLAAGFDKNAEVIGPALAMGFGFVEAGTVTPKPQAGNPRPRIFRSPKDRAVINRMGFPNDGMHVFKDNVEAFLNHKFRPHGAVGINIGMNKGQKDPARDYCRLIKMLGPMADYITINISSPNTPGLRDLQKRAPLMELLTRVDEERQKSCGRHSLPILLKLAPDLDEPQQEELAACALEAPIEGIILTNTTLSRPQYLPEDFALQAGGLSGAPLNTLSTDVIRNFYRLTEGKVPIIGAGGICSGEDAYAKIRAGASLVQLYSGLVFGGPQLINYVNKNLVSLLKRDKIATITDAIGLDARP